MTLKSANQAAAVASDISKAFDRIWQAGLLHKLKGEHKKFSNT